MKLQRFFSTTTLCLAIFAATTTAWTQFPGMGMSGMTGGPGAVPYPAVIASGTSSVKCLPETMRMMITLQAQGKTIEEALANMDTEQKSALDQIAKLGVAKERVRFDGLNIDPSQDDRRRQMEMMIAQRMRQPAGQKPPTLAETVRLKCMLVAELPLTGKTPEEILKESHTLKQNIKAADFSAKKEAMTPEEEELMEEMEGMMSRYGDDSDSDDEPRILYVANIPEAESQKAYAEAFAQARKNGEFLATAAGVKLGTLMQFSGSVVNNQRSMMGYNYSRQDYYLMELLAGSQNTLGAKQEVLAVTPDPMELVFYVHAVFMMEK